MEYSEDLNVFGEISPIACNTSEKLRDENFIRFIGWQENSDLSEYYSQDTIDLISMKVTQLTMGLHRDNRPIKVTDNVISHVMSTVYNNYRHPTGDIHSRYIIASKDGPYNYIQEMINQTIEIIVSSLRNEFGTIYNNESLSIWNTVLGDFNSQKLRQHAPIKVLNKRSDRMQFFQNY